MAASPQAEPVNPGEGAAGFARLPQPASLFRARGVRFHALAIGHKQAPRLTFLAELAAIQGQLAASLPPPEPPSIEELEGAFGFALAPVERTRFWIRDSVAATFDALLAALADLEMPEPARAALLRLTAADVAARRSALEGVLERTEPSNAPAGAFPDAALQIVFAGIATQLEAERLQPVGDGACPVCGSPPVASLMVGWQGASRHCCCALCGTSWHHARGTCTLCGATEGIACHGIADDAGTIAAESCDSCRRYVKILHQHRDPALEPVADDVASDSLDVRMRTAGFSRGAANPFVFRD